MKKKTTLLAFLLFGFLCNAQNWFQIQSGTQSKLNTISFANSQIGYIGGNDSILLKTTNGGKTWNRMAIDLPINVSNKNVMALEFLDPLVGFMIVNHLIFKTTNGGLNWVSEQPNQTNMCFKKSLYFKDAQNGFVGGSMCFQGATIGSLVSGTWDTVQVVGGWGAEEQITNFDFYDANLGLATSSGAYFFRTTNGGETWDTIPSSLDTVALSDVKFITDSLVYATYPLTGRVGVLVSTDAGLTWQEEWGFATFYYPGFNTINTNKKGCIFLGGTVNWSNKGVIFNYNNNWWNYAQVDQPINQITTYGDTVVFAVGDSGLVVTNVMPSTIGLPKNIAPRIQVFPNPAKQKITLVGIKAKSQILLTNMAGQTVLNTQIAGNQQELEIAHLATGIYFLKLTNPLQTYSVKLVVE